MVHDFLSGVLPHRDKTTTSCSALRSRARPHSSVSRSFLGLIQLSGGAGESGKAGTISVGEVLAPAQRQQARIDYVTRDKTSVCGCIFCGCADSYH